MNMRHVLIMLAVLFGSMAPVTAFAISRPNAAACAHMACDDEPCGQCSDVDICRLACTAPATPDDAAQLMIGLPTTGLAHVAQSGSILPPFDAGPEPPPPRG